MNEILSEVGESTSERENDGEHINVKPWTRFWARILDYIIFVSLVFLLANILLKPQLKGFYLFLLYHLAILVWVPVEAGLLSTWGMTPGKWLFNITLRDEKWKKPIFIAALKRSVSVWFNGIVMGIPILFLLGLLKQYRNLSQIKATVWDRKGKFIVKHDYLKGFKISIIVLIYAGFIISQIIMPSMKWGIEESSKLIKQSGIFETAYYINNTGCNLMDKGEYQKAKEQFLKGLAANPDIDLKDTLLNNLSWACYSLGEYNEALKYSEECLEISDNDDIEYVNYGNALYALGIVSEAEDAYEKAIDLNSSSSYAHYGLGMLKYDKYEYDESIELFEKYTALKQDDPDGWCYLGLSYLYGDNNLLKSKKCLDKAMEGSSGNIFVISSMADYYNYVGESQKAEELYDNALNDHPDDYTLLCDAAVFYQNEEKYDKAIEYSDRAINIDSAEYEAYRIKAQSYFWQDDTQKSIDTIHLMIQNNPSKAEVFKTAGDLYYDQYEYKLAIEAYNEALKINPLYESACIGKIESFYFSKRYTSCLLYAMSVEGKFDNYEIPWYMADIYSRLSDSTNALLYYKKALSMNESDTSLLTSIGWEYYYMEDIKNAGIYADKALEVDDSYSDATELKKMIQKKQTGIIKQVSEFIEENYMYFKPNAKYNSIKNSLVENDSADMEDIKELFNAVHEKDDLFSFVLYGENYRQYLEYQTEDTVQYSIMNENLVYIQITNFERNTANDFLNVIESLRNTEEKHLIIDLRGNGGGDTNSGGDILDFLLPDSVVCNLIYKDGYSSPFYSDEDNIKFKHIFILTDEQTASCAELVTLGLKTYLDNVTVIGRKTFGKGVGQILFEDKTRGFVIFLVNHFWNVREENITDEGILPDIPVEGNALEEYLDEVNRLIKSGQ